MASAKTVERQIGNVEGFDVTIRHPDGRDLRSDLTGLPGYSFGRGAKGSMTVRQWLDTRFSQCYPGYMCDVLDGAGAASHGGTLLSTVRESYYE